jgi:hypothetical protein
MRVSLNPDLHEMAVADPTGRTEEEWLDVFEFLLARLSATTGAKIEVGAYWLEVGAGAAALGARIRADGPLLWTASDSWEAAFCVTGDSEGAYADVMAFPFLCGSVVTRDGRMDDLNGEREVEEFWIHYADRKWEDHGWRSPDGAGEWDFIRRPGDAFFRGIRCTSVKDRFAVLEPIMISVGGGSGDGGSLGDHASLAIHRLLRNGQEIVATPSTVPLPRSGVSRRLPLGSTRLPTAFRLDSVSIPGGWVPGEYRVEIRVGYARNSTSCDSDISDAAKFEVVAS